MFMVFVSVICALSNLTFDWLLHTGATLACGTGACAVVVAAVLEGHAGRVCNFFLVFLWNVWK